MDAIIYGMGDSDDSDDDETPCPMSLDTLERHFRRLEASLAPKPREQTNVERQEVLVSAPGPSSPLRQHVSEVESRPLCTIMYEPGIPGLFEMPRMPGTCSYFAHAENKWYPLLYDPDSLLDMDWRFTAADGGLLCYKAHALDKSWLLVCNPLTKSAQLIHPDYPNPGKQVAVVQFAVDHSTKSFRLIVLHSEIMVFDSRARGWKAFEQPPKPWVAIEFVWKNVIYMTTGEFDSYVTLDTVSGLWSTAKLSLPCDPKRTFYVLSSKGKVTLYIMQAKARDPIEVWLLVEGEDAPNLTPLRWEKVQVMIPAPLRPLLGQFQDCWSHAHEFICFATRLSHHWVQYTYKTKTWRVMPRFGRERPVPLGLFPGLYQWANWEACNDMPVELEQFILSEHPE